MKAEEFLRTETVSPFRYVHVKEMNVQLFRKGINNKKMKQILIIQALILILLTRSTASEKCYRFDDGHKVLDRCEIHNFLESSHYCKTICVAFGYNYGGPRSNLYCCCGEKLLSSDETNDGCEETCSNSSKEICGTESSALISNFESLESTLKVKNEYFRLGCYEKTEYHENIDLGEIYIFRGFRNWDHQLCFALCDLLKSTIADKIMYAGLSLYDMKQGCFCSAKRGSNKKLNLNECNSRCEANTKLQCGQKKKALIFQMNDFCYYYDEENAIMDNCKIPNFLGTSIFCKTICESAGYEYGGPRGNDFCCCGDVFLTEKKAKPEECYTTCKNSDEYCGKTGAAYIEKLGNTSVELKIINEYYPKGCYPMSAFSNDTEDDLFFLFTGLRKWTHEFCFGVCDLLNRTDIIYAGLTVVDIQQTCFCATYMKEEESALDINCGVPCEGNLDQKCGGKDYVWLFENQEITTMETTTITDSPTTTETTSSLQTTIQQSQTSTKEMRTTEIRTTSHHLTNSKTTSITTSKTKNHEPPPEHEPPPKNENSKENENSKKNENSNNGGKKNKEKTKDATSQLMSATTKRTTTTKSNQPFLFQVEPT